MFLSRFHQDRCKESEAMWLTGRLCGPNVSGPTMVFQFKGGAISCSFTFYHRV